MKTKIAAILARVSRPTQNMESQVSDLMRVATEMGYTVPSQFIFKEQISGINSGRKESLERILSAIENKKNEIQAVFIWEITRLNRDAMDFTTELNEFIKRNTPVFFLDAELWSMDPNTKDLLRDNTNQLIGASIYGLKEWQKIAQRTKRGRDNIAKQGYYVGHVSDGYIPVKDGKHKVIKVDNQRKDVIKRIFKLYVEGNSTDMIAQIFNAENIPTTSKYRCASPLFNYKKSYKRAKGNGIEYYRDEALWQGAQIAQILSNRWYIGERYYGGVKHTIEPIIEEDVFKEAEIMRTKRAANFRTDRTSKLHNYLLGGLIFCGNCGRKLYGHSTGQNNHYYCSSTEEGEKCGLQGVCKENIEAIVCEMIKMRAIGYLLNKEGDVSSDFFKLNDQEISKTKERISTLKERVKIEKLEIDNLDSRRETLYSMLADGKDPKTIENILKQDEHKRIEYENKVAELIAEIDSNERRIRAERNVDKIITTIEQTTDIRTLRQLIESTIKRVEIHNVDKSISIVKMVYLNDKVDLFIYSYRLLKNKFISLTFLEDSLPIHIDLDSKSVIIENGKIAFDENGLLYHNNEIPNNLLSYEKRMTVRELVLNMRKGSPCLYEYDRTLFEEDDDRKKAQREKYREWRKKYNTNLPTTVHFVVKDTNYEEYVKQRKHLYNRKCKIKKNKRLSEEAKKQELERINEALSLLKAKVKYLNRDEAVKRYLNNDNKK